MAVAPAAVPRRSQPLFTERRHHDFWQIKLVAVPCWRSAFLSAGLGWQILGAPRHYSEPPADNATASRRRSRSRERRRKDRETKRSVERPRARSGGQTCLREPGYSLPVSIEEPADLVGGIRGGAGGTSGTDGRSVSLSRNQLTIPSWLFACSRRGLWHRLDRFWFPRNLI